MAQSDSIAARYKHYFAAAGSAPFDVAGARNALLIDRDGREFIDLTSGWNVANVGWNNPRVLAATARQLEKLPLRPAWCSSEEPVLLAEALESTLQQPLRILGATGGSEAVEMALKAARRITGRQAVVGVSECYHGATLDAGLAGGVPTLHRAGIEKSAYRHIPIPDGLRGDPEERIKEMRRVITQKPRPAAVLLETIMTNPGVIVPSERFFTELQQAIDDVGALLIADEVGTGFARTGSWFAFQQFPLRPDIVVVAKALSGAVLPIGAAILLGETSSSVKGIAFDSTFAWTPLACAAALETLKIIGEEELAQRAARLGEAALEQLENGLDSVPAVAGIRGKGLEIGIELTSADNEPIPGKKMSEILRACRERGVFVESSRYTSTIIVMPPLTISEAHLTQALAVVIDSVSEMEL